MRTPNPPRPSPKFRRRSGLLFIAIAVPIASSAARGQVVLDGSLGAAGALPGPNYLVPDSAGQIRGGNLFHSFSELSVAQGELLAFTGPGSVQNVLARVTGPNASTIDGAIGTNIPGANLFLINPRGITFGPNATVIVPGSFVATTADFIGFADGTGRFDAASPAGTVLTSAPPSAFGFLPSSGGAARIDVNGSSLGVTGRTTLTLVGGEVRIAGAFLLAQGGRANFVAARDGTLQLDPVDVDAVLDAGGLTTRGPVSFFNALVVVDGDDAGGTGAGGRVDVLAADAMIDAASRISSTTIGDVDGLGINFDVTGVLTVTGGSSLATASLGNGRSGDLVLSAADVRVIGQSGLGEITTVTTFSFGPGPSGDVRVNADSVLVSAVQPDGATLSTAAGGQATNTVAGSGRGGSLVVDARQVRIDGTGANLRTSTLNDQAAPGGNITITADTIEVTGGAQIDGQSGGNGVSGLIDITARDLLLVRDSATVDNPVLGPVPFPSSVSTTTFIGTAKAQGVRIRGGRVLIEQRGSIDTQTTIADAAPIDINVDALELNSGGRILADSSGAGDGGAITIAARVVDLNGDTTTISSSTSGTGQGGAIGITATERVRLLAGSTVLTAALGDGSGPVGNGGAMFIEAPDVEARDTSLFSAGTIDGGDAGELVISADRILFSGSRSGVSSPTVVTDVNRRSGIGGRVLLTASESITLERGARVSTIAGTRETGGSPPGTDTTALTGVAGDATLIAPLVRVTGRENPDDPNSPPSRVTSVTNLKTPGAAAGGNVIVLATPGRVEVTDGGLLTAGTTGAGAGGDVTVVADEVLLDGGTLSSTSTFLGDTSLGLTPGVGGNVVVGANGSVRLRNRALISVESAGTDAGSIQVIAADRIRLTDSRVVTRAAGAGGNITLGSRDPDTGAINPFVILFDSSEINANAVAGNGGNIDIISDEYVTSADTIVTATSEQSDPGVVDVSAAYTELAGGLVQLPSDFASDAAALQDQCGLRVQGEQSSFIATGRGGTPLTPDGVQPSFDLPRPTR